MSKHKRCWYCGKMPGDAQPSPAMQKALDWVIERLKAKGLSWEMHEQPCTACGTAIVVFETKPLPEADAAPLVAEAEANKGGK